MSVDDRFLIELENYEFGVRRIIPAAPAPADRVDDAFSDELDNLLHARDYLESTLRVRANDPEYVSHLDRVRELDAILRAKRLVVLRLISNFSHWRERFKVSPPRSHWWWYLDQLDGNGYEVEEEIILLPSERVGIAFDRQLTEKIGLRAGQRVTVQVPDEKHIVISVP